MKEQHPKFPGMAWFVIEPIAVPRQPFRTRISCLVCGQAIAVVRQKPYAIYRIGREIIGVVCDGCLSEPTREKLAVLRRERQEASRR
jgi:hypothetical protein